MTIEELKKYLSCREDYKVGNNKYKCPLCGKIFSVKAFSLHIRKEHYNKSNSIKNSGGYNGHYNNANFIKKVSIAAYKNNKKRYDEKLGTYKDFEVECANQNCHKHFIITIREKKFLEKEHYFCCKHCAYLRTINEQQKEKISKTLKKRATYLRENNIEEFNRCFGFNQVNEKSINKRFTSKNEVLIRDSIIEKFPNDCWTFGGVLKFDNLGIVRDLYSDKLKICFEYDGIWHFKDIHGQLELKLKKDRALEKWCIENHYRLVRITESWFIDLHKDIDCVISLLYDRHEQIIKIGNEYNFNLKCNSPQIHH